MKCLFCQSKNIAREWDRGFSIIRYTCQDCHVVNAMDGYAWNEQLGLWNKLPPRIGNDSAMMWALEDSEASE